MASSAFMLDSTALNTLLSKGQGHKSYYKSNKQLIFNVIC